MYSRTAVAIAVGLAALLAVGVIVASKIIDTPPTAAPTTTTAAPRTGPVPLVPVDAPDAGSPGCASLVAALPPALTSGNSHLGRLALAEPAPPATAAWGDAGNPVVLRCGLPRPPELTETSALREISGVRWLPVSTDGRSTWYVVDRGVFVALTVPENVGTGPIQEISETITKAL
jgi:Protein of unknown function (DUF3515)